MTATYTLNINRPIPKSELITALETILALNQVSVSPMGDRFLKVTPLSTAKSEAPEMIIGTSLNLPPSGRIVTKLFELNFLRVSEFVPQIQLFMTPGIGNGIVQLEKANVALVTDSLENIQRIERLIQEVSMTGDRGTYPVQTTVRKQGRTLTFDNAGTHPQVGAINVGFAASVGVTVAVNVIGVPGSTCPEGDAVAVTASCGPANTFSCRG